MVEPETEMADSPIIEFVSFEVVRRDPSTPLGMTTFFLQSTIRRQAPSVDGFSVAPIDSRIVVSACTFFIRT